MLDLLATRVEILRSAAKDHVSLVQEIRRVALVYPLWHQDPPRVRQAQ
ncbi:MAG: hypothetical protein AAGA08_10380 [Pseudomonadota bacterium]